VWQHVKYVKQRAVLGSNVLGSLWQRHYQHLFFFFFFLYSGNDSVRGSINIYARILSSSSRLFAPSCKETAGGEYINQYRNIKTKKWELEKACRETKQQQRKQYGAIMAEISAIHAAKAGERERRNEEEESDRRMAGSWRK